MPSVCLITQAHLSQNPRLVKEADALAEAGYQVSVISPTYSKWGREADRAFAGRPWRIVASPPFGPLSPRTARVRELTRRAFAGAAVRLGSRRPKIVNAAWHPATPELVREGLEVRADLYIAHYPAALPAAAAAARRHGARYAFDAEDFHLGDPPEGPRYDLQRALLREIEGRYLPGCAFVTAASPMIADAYAKAYGVEKPVTILNVFRRDTAIFPTEGGTAEPGPSVYWVSQTIGPDRGLEAAAEAIGKARSRPHLYLRGAEVPGYVQELRRIAGDAGDRLHILPLAPPDQMERLATQHDLGLVGETGATPNRRIALTNKQFTYLVAGVPSLLSNIPAHSRLAEELGPAAELYEVDEAVALAAAMDRYLLDPAYLAKARAHAFRLGQERFNWDVEKRKLLDLVEAALAGERR